MALQHSKLLILFLLISSKIEATYGNATSTTTLSSSSSPLLKKASYWRPSGCGRRPWICSRGEFPPRRLCCRNRCVDVTSDRNNCGFCGVRCVFNMQCCAALCSNTNIDPFNCGSCGHVCSFGNLCAFGLCGYAQQQPPPPPPCPPTPKQMPPPRPPRLLRQPPSEGHHRPHEL